LIGPASFHFTKHLLSIIVVTLDNAKNLDLLLRGLEKNTKFVPFEVLVHCNSVLDLYTNETIKVISKWQEEGIVTNLTTSLYNHYVAAPANALARFAHGNYIVFLDDDVYPSPGWDGPLLNAISASHHCSFVTPT
jgi:GT2 family glycosyltransferase